MRKEIVGILLAFLVVLTLASMLSYSHEDPAINSATASGDIHNLFGRFGAHLAGALVGVFGLGAFWVPVLLLLSCIRFIGNLSSRAIYITVLGGLLLIVSTGCLFALKGDRLPLLGTVYSSGGFIGISLKILLVKYTNLAGAIIILVLLFVTGLILATGFSLVAFGQRCEKAALFLLERTRTLSAKLLERRRKAKKRSKLKKKQATKRTRKIEIKAAKPEPAPKPPAPKQEVFEFMRKEAGFQMPSVGFLDDPEVRPDSINDENLKMQSMLLEKKLNDFAVDGKVKAVIPGPVITTFEYEPAPGIKINRVVALTDDLALALRASSIRIVAPVPGKAVIGIEIPNVNRETVRFKELIASSAFEKSRSKLTLCLGKDIEGNPVVNSLERMPHLLIAGATGTGKSVALNTMICSILYRSSPEDARFIMVDPKRIELSLYDGIPHLITPVVTDVRKATNALFWAVNEMETRYELLSKKQAKNVEQYNRKIDEEGKGGGEEMPERLPYIVIVIDELADLMIAASRDVELALTRLAQMARAAGIHLIIATQRPSVDVLTGIIKANFPTRLSFQVSSKTDSRTIIDTNGAENLLGSGDMLLLPPGTAKLQRIHGAYISETELVKITSFLKRQEPPEYDTTVTEAQVEDRDGEEAEEHDERYDDAVALVTRTRQASISMVQRHLRVGYNRAARMIEMMEKEGVVGPSDGVKPREVLVRGYDDMP